MCNKKERKRDRQAVVLFPVSTLGAVYFVVHGGTGRICFFSGWDGAGLFFRGGTGRLLFFSEAGRGGCCFFPRRDGVASFFFSTGRDGAVFFFIFEGRDGTVVFGGGIFLAGRGKIVTPSRQRRFKPSCQPSM